MVVQGGDHLFWVLSGLNTRICLYLGFTAVDVNRYWLYIVSRPRWTIIINIDPIFESEELFLLRLTCLKRLVGAYNVLTLFGCSNLVQGLRIVNLNRFGWLFEPVLTQICIGSDQHGAILIDLFGRKAV